MIMMLFMFVGLILLRCKCEQKIEHFNLPFGFLDYLFKFFKWTVDGVIMENGRSALLIVE